MSKFFIGLGLAFWASIGVTGYFVLKLVWGLDNITVHPGQAFVSLLLLLFWLGWFVIGAGLGAASIAAGLDD